MSKCLLEFLNILLRYLCIVHGFNKHTPGGRLAAFASYPFGQPSLGCIFFLWWRGIEACFYCGCIKLQTFKKCPRLSCSFFAYILS